MRGGWLSMRLEWMGSEAVDIPSFLFASLEEASPSPLEPEELPLEMGLFFYPGE
jgi:hypothetical protein